MIARKQIENVNKIYASVNTNLMVENVTQIKSGITINASVSVKIREKNCIWDSATCSFEYGKYVGSIIDNSVVTCDEVMKETILFYQNST